jgi:hypothetical protein
VPFKYYQALACGIFASRKQVETHYHIFPNFFSFFPLPLKSSSD